METTALCKLRELVRWQHIYIFGFWMNAWVAIILSQKRMPSRLHILKKCVCKSPSWYCINRFQLLALQTIEASHFTYDLCWGYFNWRFPRSCSDMCFRILIPFSHWHCETQAYVMYDKWLCMSSCICMVGEYMLRKQIPCRLIPPLIIFLWNDTRHPIY